MVGTTTISANPVTLAAVSERHVGSIFLHGRQRASVAATKAIVTQFTSLVSRRRRRGVPLWVSTDQEGGEVQVLSGPGFDAIPSRRRARSAAGRDAAGGRGELGRPAGAGGVNLNLAPVADIVTQPGDRPRQPADRSA